MDFYVDSYFNNDSIHTTAINNAIIDCYNNGGGRVIFSSGKIYRSGTIYLLDNVELYFEDNAILMASDDVADFDITGKSNEENGLDVPTWENCDYNGNPTKYFIYGVNKKNVSITGNGIIDGNEEIFYGKVSKYHIDGYFYPRVPLIYLIGCNNIKINNVTLRRSAFWTVHLVGCDTVAIDSVKILNNLRLANSDGIDPDHCKNVLIKNCYIEAADDCIVFKATESNEVFGACENIEVYNCTLMSTSAAIKFGTESVSDFKNIHIHDCDIIKSNRGISFQLRDCGNISNIRFENINIETKRFSPLEWWGKAEPINITAVKRRNDTFIGSISDITFKNINCDSENGIFIFGEDNINIKNILFENVNVGLKAKTKWERNNHDLRPSYKYHLIEGPINVIYCKNACDIILDGFSYSLDETISKELEDVFFFSNTKNVVSR